MSQKHVAIPGLEISSLLKYVVLGMVGGGEGGKVCASVSPPTKVKNEFMLWYFTVTPEVWEAYFEKACAMHIKYA